MLIKKRVYKWIQSQRQIGEHSWEFTKAKQNSLSQHSWSLTKGNSTMLYAYDKVCQSNETSVDVQFPSLCNHEEAHTRVFLHVKDMARNGYKKTCNKNCRYWCSNLGYFIFHELKVDLDELLVDFGVGKNKCFFWMHGIYHQIGEERSRRKPFFHAMTGCDQVFFLLHVTKLSTWKVWELFGDFTSVFVNFRNQPSLNEVRNAMPTLGWFTVLLYSHSSNALSTNKCRRELFCQDMAIDNIPPTEATLWKHMLLRTAYYSGHVWGQSLMVIQVLPLPEEWSWKHDSDKLIPEWTDLPEALSAVCDLIKYRCDAEKGCRVRCKCVNVLLTCAGLCKEGCKRDYWSQWTQAVIGLIVFLEKQVFV